MSTTTRFIAGDPYPWPYNGDLRPDNTALIVIDMQTDFCGKGGYIDLHGLRHLAVPRAASSRSQRVLEAMRARRLHIIHTREGHRPDLADLPANKRWRSRQTPGTRARHRRPGAVRPHPGARRAGLGASSPSSRPSRVSRSSTSRARARSAPPTST